MKFVVAKYITTIGKTDNLYNMVWGNIEHKLVNITLIHTRGNKIQADKILCINRITSYRMMNKRVKTKKTT